MTIYLPVNIKTGEVDYEFVTHFITSLPAPKHLELVEGYEYKQFDIVAK